ncbi:MAG: NAD(P)/FAD-dependent oxidoreductase [Clostridia bacterium]|nr:NAD(P)/FAD-dependent oxidoreductase [Clostridia bacterium]
MYDVAIVGCGVIGAAAAYYLSMYDLKILVLEKENDIAMGATRANSAIIHAGYDPEPGTLMARLNVRGCEMAKDLCDKLSVPYRQCGSLVLAFSAAEDETVKILYDRGVQNGVKGLMILTAEEVHEMEPQVSDQVTSALYAPSAGIVNPWEYALAFAEVAVLNGVELYRNSEVTDIRKTEKGFEINAGKNTFESRFVINAAGVDSAFVHEMVADRSFTVKPSKGSYYLMDKCECARTNHVLFQCPSEKGKGVLVSPTVHGNLIVGPDAEPSKDMHRVNTTAASLSYVKSAAAKSVPGIDYRNAIRNFAGMRANTDQSDFVIGFAAPGFLDLAGIKSPGLTSAPAIGEEAVKLLREAGLELVYKVSPVQTRKKLRFKELSEEEKRAVIAKNPLYGRVICRCETITEGEIVDAIRSPIPPVSVDGIKRRAGTGMGRCQGGFCGPRVLEILARELEIDPKQVLKDQAGSYILADETKTGGMRV